MMLALGSSQVFQNCPIFVVIFRWHLVTADQFDRFRTILLDPTGSKVPNGPVDLPPTSLMQDSNNLKIADLLLPWIMSGSIGDARRQRRAHIQF